MPPSAIYDRETLSLCPSAAVRSVIRLCVRFMKRCIPTRFGNTRTHPSPSLQRYDAPPPVWFDRSRQTPVGDYPMVIMQTGHLRSPSVSPSLCLFSCEKKTTVGTFCASVVYRGPHPFFLLKSLMFVLAMGWPKIWRPPRAETSPPALSSTKKVRL